MSGAAAEWSRANQRYLMAALDVVRAALERHASGGAESRVDAARRALDEAAAGLPGVPALATLCDTFGLAPFERDTLLLCAGMELSASFALLCAEAQGDGQRPFPTWGLALAALDEPGWAALSPEAPLRRWRLVEVGAGPALTRAPLRIDERILHYLAGVRHRDERLAGVVQPLPAAGELVPSHRALAEQLAATWARAAGTGERLPALQLCGAEPTGKRAIAAATCGLLELDVGMVSAHSLPLVPGELDTLVRLWERESALDAAALFLDCDASDAPDPAREEAVARLIEGVHGPLFVASHQPRRSRGRPMVNFDVRKPTTTEQREVWAGVLGELAPTLNGAVETLVSQFDVTAPTIRAACAGALGRLAAEHEDPASPAELGEALWDSCRVQARRGLDELAQWIETTTSWDDLILPEPQRSVLREIAAQVRRRSVVYDRWGFGSRGGRGLGVTALFAGESGTGKTTAAEVLAGELRLDLYRIDLATMVSKYIGETEKNLRRVFDAAEEGGTILLFDEADALFGKRSEVKDSHDRHANIEVSYLLQRMEAYRGLAILTTNLKEALDTAFLRRLRFVVHFPFPDPATRAEIWRRVFPGAAPVEGLDYAALARLNVSGGHIRNIALNGAFLAAEEGTPVRMSHLLRAARSEYAKLEKPLADSEVRGWA
ncbi:MAG TPA: ATP-binding protein [Longimicrobiaceae bacterium]|nr:ATP-binding protein [Longimicrobiaceae bacterium]